MPPSITSRKFGSHWNGELIEAWTLVGSGGMVVESLTYGGAVTRVLIPDRTGRLDDVVLGFDRFEPYLTNHVYMGAIVGRVAGRMTGGSFTLGGKTYELSRNEGLNHLHGGEMGFNKKTWIASPGKSLKGEPSLRLTYRSRDGEEGYPGNVDVQVTYTVTGRNALLVETDAVSDLPTPFSPTMHHYFNLAGEDAGSILDHELQIDSSKFIPTDEQMTLSGEVKSVNGRANDFRRPRRLGDAIPLLFQHHGDLYLLNKTSRAVQHSDRAPAARLVHASSDRVLEVFTTETHLQLYTSVGFDGSLVGVSGKPYAQYAAVCLECHGYPGVTSPQKFGDIILHPGKPFRRTTEYAFSNTAVDYASSR